MASIREIKLSDIEGFKIGHAQNEKGITGCTVIICEKGATAGCDVRGGGPASRETEALKSVNMVEQIHAVMLSGGSAYGLDAASGAMQYLEEKGAGFDVGVGVVPIVCGASLFDLVVGDPKCRPDKAMGYQACKNSENLKTCEMQGSIGAGIGATVGKFLGTEYMMKSGLGTYAVQTGTVKCGAIVVVNALGDVVDIETGEILAGMLNEAKNSFANTEKIMLEQISKERNVFNGNTTLGCIITNVKITKTQCNKLAQIVHNAYARAIRPVHTYADGDTIFIMSTCEVEADIMGLGVLATNVMAKAINNAVIEGK